MVVTTEQLTRQQWVQEGISPGKPQEPGDAGPCLLLQTRAYKMEVSFVWATSLPGIFPPCGEDIPSLRMP